MNPGEAIRLVTVLDGDDLRRRDLAERLAASGYRVAAGADAEALHVDEAPRADLFVLDLAVPGCDGLALLRGLRAVTRAPIILVTGRGSVAEEVEGLELSADDYIAGPFDPRELVARGGAVLRRHELVAHAASRSVLQRWAFAGWQLDALTR